MSKRVAGWALVAAVGIIGAYSWTSHAASLEDSQATAGAIVTKAKELAKVSATPSVRPELVERSATRPNALQSALRKCPDAIRRGFLSSLVFVDGKFAGAEVQGVQECLGNGEYKALRAMFGKLGNDDHKGYYCESVGTCSESSKKICTGNCRSGYTSNASLPVGERGYVSVEQALAGQSLVVRNQHLDNLALENERIDMASLRVKGKN